MASRKEVQKLPLDVDHWLTNQRVGSVHRAGRLSRHLDQWVNPRLSGKSRQHREVVMDANGLVVMPGKGSAWKMAPGRSSTLKLRNGETDESVMIFEEVAPVGTVTPMHLHHDSDEVAYVLSGEITFKIGDAVTVGGPGTCAFMPRDVAHAWKSTGAETGRVLFMYTPGRAGKLFEEMVERPVDPMNQQEFGAVAERHGWEIVGPPPF